jgi:hypothetical protein
MHDPVAGRLAYMRSKIQEGVQRTEFMWAADSLRSALATSTKPFFHDGEKTGLHWARITKGTVQRDDDGGLSCKGLAFVGCDFSGCILNSVSFTNCSFDWCRFDEVSLGGQSRFELTKFKRCSFDDAVAPAKFDRCTFELCPMGKTDFSYATLKDVGLKVVDLSTATFAGATFAGVNFKYSAGLVRLNGSNIPACPRPQDDAIEEPEVPAIDERLAWDRLRAVGRLPVFSVSSAALVLSSIHLYGIATWNDMAARADQRLAAAGEKAEALFRGLRSGLPPDVPWRDSIIAASVEASAFVQQFSAALPRLPLPSHAFWLFVGTVLLALGSGLYLLRCPPRIHRYSDVEWRDEIRGSPFHYLPLAYSRRWSRVCVAFALALGGALTASVAVSKLFTTGLFILDQGGVPWPFR